MFWRTHAHSCPIKITGARRFSHQNLHHQAPVGLRFNPLSLLSGFLNRNRLMQVKLNADFSILLKRDHSIGKQGGSSTVNFQNYSQLRFLIPMTCTKGYKSIKDNKKYSPLPKTPQKK